MIRAAREHIGESTELGERTVAELVLDAQSGSRDAFGEIFKRFERAVFGWVFARLKNHSEAQEVTQEVFIHAFEKLHQLREPKAFAGWLRQTAYHMAINHAVRKPPTVATEPETMEARCVETRTPLAEALAPERQSQVRAGIARLRELDRATLEAFYDQGHSLIEMSDEFNAPIGTIKR
jgi:RNA polymerase sigma-70 factor (ECF subfamily)